MLICGAIPGVFTQETALPPDTQAQLLMNVLSFDRSQKERLSKGLTVGVLYDSRMRASARLAGEIAEALPRAAESLNSRVQAVKVDMKPNNDLTTRLRELGAKAVYVTPLRSADVARVAAACRAEPILSFTAVKTYLGQGLAVGLVRQGDQSEVLINLTASRAAGAVFSSQLLRVAGVVE